MIEEQTAAEPVETSDDALAEPIRPAEPVRPAESGARDVPPDRLAIASNSPFHDPERLVRGIGIRFKGAVRTNVEEYCISEGWVRVQAGKALDRRGQPMTLKLSGPVEAWYEDLGEGAPVARKDIEPG